MNPNPTHNANPRYFVHFSSLLEAAVAEAHLLDNSVDTAQLDAVAVGQLVESTETNVEASRGAVNSQDVHRLAVVGRGPACAAVGRVPAGDSGSTANVGEARDLALGLPGSCQSRGLFGSFIGERLVLTYQLYFQIRPLVPSEQATSVRGRAALS